MEHIMFYKKSKNTISNFFLEPGEKSRLQQSFDDEQGRSSVEAEETDPIEKFQNRISRAQQEIEVIQEMI